MSLHQSGSMIVHPQVNGAGPNQGQMTRSQILSNLNESVWIQIGTYRGLAFLFPLYVVTNTFARLVDRINGRPGRRYRRLPTGPEAQPVVCRRHECYFSYFAGTREVSGGNGVPP